MFYEAYSSDGVSPGRIQRCWYAISFPFAGAAFQRGSHLERLPPLLPAVVINRIKKELVYRTSFFIHIHPDQNNPPYAYLILLLITCLSPFFLRLLPATLEPATRSFPIISSNISSFSPTLSSPPLENSPSTSPSRCPTKLSPDSTHVHSIIPRFQESFRFLPPAQREGQGCGGLAFLTAYPAGKGTDGEMLLGQIVSLPGTTQMFLPHSPSVLFPADSHSF